MKADRRLSLPVNDRRLDYKDRLRLQAGTSSGESGSDLPMNSNQNDLDEEKSDTPVPVRRRRTYSTSDADLCIPEIVIEEAPPTNGVDSNHSLAMANLRQMQRVTFKMDHLRIGDVLAEHVIEKQQKTTATLLKRQELANEQIAKPTSPPGNRRKSVPNLKIVEEEDGADE